jgi:hypothetical protein
MAKAPAEATLMPDTVNASLPVVEEPHDTTKSTPGKTRPRTSFGSIPKVMTLGMAKDTRGVAELHHRKESIPGPMSTRTRTYGMEKAVRRAVNMAKAPAEVTMPGMAVPVNHKPPRGADGATEPKKAMTAGSPRNLGTTKRRRS